MTQPTAHLPALSILRGGGDLASGVALRLHRAGLRLIITELPQPLVVRRRVSFAEAVYSGEAIVEGVVARRVANLPEALQLMDQGIIPVMVDPKAEILIPLLPSNGSAVSDLQSPVILIDARMTKGPPEIRQEAASIVIGLGPGFVAGENCHAVVETNRGHAMGRVIWNGPAEADTGVPEEVVQRGVERVLRAPAEGIIETLAEIGDHLEPGQVVAAVAGKVVQAPFQGVLRGLIHGGLAVSRGVKIGDVDPRDDPRLCIQVSDKALAVGGGVLEAILSRPVLRKRLWDCYEAYSGAPAS